MWHWDVFLRLAVIFRDFCIGLGAAVGGISAFKVISDWRKESKKSKYITHWKNRFPRTKLGNKNGFDLVELDTNNKVYIVDRVVIARYWIKNPETFIDMGFDGSDIKPISKDTLNKYVEGDPINFLDNLSENHSKP